jgi:formylglycine-generating enzyme required for sulfatase activity
LTGWLVPLVILALASWPAATSHALEQKVVNGLGMEFVLIPAGTFIMGSPAAETHRNPSEIQHQVTISRPFYMQTSEVTVEQWRAVMGRRLFARKSGGGDMPVVTVSWYDCNRFIHKLNQMTGEQYRLPTEAQWEYAARAGSRSAYFWGERIDCARAMYANNPLKYDACVSANTAAGLKSGQPAPVEHYPANAWGLYDMHGNVWEWCRDLYSRYPAVPVIDPCQTIVGEYRVRRGGSWLSAGDACRSANRAYGHPMSRLRSTGFRLVREIPDR